MRLVSFLITALCFSTSASASLITVHVFNNDYSLNPKGQTIVDPTINLGDTVKWTWDEGFHGVTTVKGSIEMFDSGLFTPAHTFEHTFSHTGTYTYYCTMHGSDNNRGGATGMAGTITVIPVPEPSSTFFFAATTSLLALRRRHGNSHSAAPLARTNVARASCPCAPDPRSSASICGPNSGMGGPPMQL